VARKSGERELGKAVEPTHSHDRALLLSQGACCGRAVGPERGGGGAEEQADLTWP
jgi:hypothetical protein